MNKEDFIDLEYHFIEDIKESEIYKEYLSLASEIESDESIMRLKKERDELLARSNDVIDEKEKRDLLLRFAKKDDQLKDIEIVKRFLYLKKQLNDILKNVTDRINKELFL